jgi:hypothetical protein
MTQLPRSLTDELLAWRKTLEQMRGANVADIDAVIHHIDQSIISVKARRGAEGADEAS